jgi:hypothetical protein
MEACMGGVGDAGWRGVTFRGVREDFFGVLETAEAVRGGAAASMAASFFFHQPVACAGLARKL